MPRAAPAVGTQTSATASAARATRSPLDTRRLAFGNRQLRVEHPTETVLELDRRRPAEHLLRAGDVGLPHLRVVDRQRLVDDLARRTGDADDRVGQLLHRELAR